MASKLETEFGENFNICHVCRSEYRIPKLLPCIHSFCEECLEEHFGQEEEGQCPTCQAVCKLPDTGLRGLKTNFHLVSLIEEYHLLQTLASAMKTPSVCHSCKRAKIVAFCMECNFAICLECKNHHLQFPFLRSHSLIPVSKLIFHKGSKPPPHCGLHPSKTLQFNCKTCSQLICRECTIVMHPKPDHEYTEATGQLQSDTKELVQMIKTSEQKIQDVMRFIREGKDCLKFIAAEKKRIQLEVTNHHQKLIVQTAEAYTFSKERMLSEISGKSDQIKANITQTKGMVKQMQATAGLYRKVAKVGNKFELLSVSDNLEKACKEVHERKCFQWPDARPDSEIAFFPEPTPNLRLGNCHLFPCFALNMTYDDDIFLCQINKANKQLSITKIKKSTGKADPLSQQKWENDIKEDANISACYQHSDYLYIGIGNTVAKFNTETHMFINKKTVTSADNIITSLHSCPVQKLGGHWEFQLGVVDNSRLKYFDENLEMKREYHYGSTAEYSYATTSISGVHNILFCYKTGYLQTYIKHFPGNSMKHDINTPAVKNMSVHSVLHTCSFSDIKDVVYVDRRPIYCTHFHTFLLWTRENNRHDGIPWAITEYNTKERATVAVLICSEKDAHRLPAAMSRQKELHLFDYQGRETRYKRPAYDKNIVMYELTEN